MEANMRVLANRRLARVLSLAVTGAACAIGCGSSGGGGGGGVGGHAGTGGLAGGGNAGAGAGTSGNAGAGGSAGTGAGGSAGVGGSGNSGGHGGAAGGAVSACPGAPQTNFKYSAKGDSNPYFTSSVGVRTANQFLIFSGYAGPAPSGYDAGTNSADAGAGPATANIIYLQTFDAVTGTKTGPAAPLLQAANGASFYVYDVAIAPTGEIVLLHASSQLQSDWNDTLYASFFSPTSSGSGVQLVRTVQVESAPLGNAHASWSVANHAFVLSWKYITTNWFLAVKKFNLDGTHAGGDTSVVPTPFGYQNDPNTKEGFTGSSGSLLGVASTDPSTGLPILTALDSSGNQVGSFTELSTSLTVDSWITVAGTASGFVTFFTSGGTTGYETFAPTSGDGGVPGTPIPVVDGGEAGLTTPIGGSSFSFPSTASFGQAINDDTGGAGGIGLVLLDVDGANFFYVNADGVQHQVIDGLISAAAGSQVSITNYHGSFGVTLFPSSATDNSTQIVGSTCKTN
jgi:hypothetical protein